MQPTLTTAPIPDLRIIPVASLYPHEEHDSQRSMPLIEAMREAAVLMNPPIVTPLDDEHYIILDGANRCFTFEHLGYPHILVQVVHYHSGTVLLDVWQHIISGWNVETFLQQVRELDEVALMNGAYDSAVAQLVLPDESRYSVHYPAQSVLERNGLLRQLVSLYQTQATLDRTAIREPHQLIPLYPDAIAVVIFPHYQPEDILEAARRRAYLPPGISRHIIQGRAIRVNYPMEALRDEVTSLEEKNEALREWMQQKFARRQVRYYAESTYQFDE